MTEYGVVTRNAEETEWPDFDLAFYEVKDVTGRSAEPVETAVNMVSCFGDNAAAEANPELVPVDADGRSATRDLSYFDWAYVCPTHEEYRRGLLEIVEDCAAVNGDVRLDDVGFPREGFCRCDRCEGLFEASDHEEWADWRAEVITEFVAEATERIPGTAYLTLYPDPYPGHLYDRAGLDLDALAPHVDEFVVPLYDTHYATTYWLETIAKGFESRLADLNVTFSVELYAVNVDVDDLNHAAEVAAAYGEDVFFGYDASQSVAALRRMKADAREGRSYGGDDPEDVSEREDGGRGDATPDESA
ncbi:hypothetical protein GRX01_06440 [Halobaculum sp. WSA2]|uniref:Glycoside hydrolase domain protein n=1 Tax=Halobaculum saliterrae TaxID=2073113 RepID=A0A6B0T3A0_9EURY|nr:hypothetical protein [Halobaculum saliterrae]MXR40979.1 hypothetical protein [Halobaculum saliterrae]